MSKAYWNGPGRGGTTRVADDASGSEDDYRHSGYGYDSYESGYDPYERTVDLGAAQDYPDDEYDYRYAEAPDRRWRWIAALAGVVLLVALVAIAVATSGDDTSTRAATPSPTVSGGQDALSTTPRTVIATVPPTSAAPVQVLPPETVVTVTSSHLADAPPPEAPPAPEAVPAGPTITYTVTGTRQLFDLVTIIYTDEQGFPRTDINVALPWTKTLVLNPGVETKSVTATSLTGQLNCTVTDGSGATLAVQANNAAIASCTQ